MADCKERLSILLFLVDRRKHADAAISYFEKRQLYPVDEGCNPSYGG
jgi:hypothetical protein